MKRLLLLTLLIIEALTCSPCFAAGTMTTLEKYTAQSDVIIKATALRTQRQEDTQVDPWFPIVEGAARSATRFKIVSVIKGEISADEVTFRHYQGLSIGPPIRVYFFELPPCYTFQSGQTYLLWADKTEDGNLRQLSKELARCPTDGGTTGYTIRVGDNVPVDEAIKNDVKSVVWDELVKMVRSNKQGDASQGLSRLRSLSGASVFWLPPESVNKNPDFPLSRFADVAIPLLSSSDEEILYRGLNALSGNAAPFAQSQLLLIANGHANPGTRSVALGCLRGLKTPEQHSAALRALHEFPASINGSDNIAALQQSALQTLADFPGHDARLHWRAFANHPKSRVRRGIASAIGAAKDGAAADLVNKMLSDPYKIVRETALDSLLRLPAAQAKPFWKRQLANASYRPLFINALAAQNAEPYLDELIKIVNEEVRAEQVLNYKLNNAKSDSWQLLFKYVNQKPKAALQSASLSRILAVLECAQIAPPTLYRFYRVRKMDVQAKSYRDVVERRLPKVYNKDFNNIDRELAKR